MTLASPKRCGLPRLRRFDRYLLVTQKLGILIQQCNDPEHLEDADYNQQKEHFGWNTQDGISDIERVRNRSELSNVIERRERVLRCGDNDGRGTARPTTPGILWCRPLKHMETKLLWLQAKHEERNLTVVKEPTQTNTAHGFTKVLRTVTDTTTVTMSRPASEKRLQSQDDGHHPLSGPVIIVTSHEWPACSTRNNWSSCVASREEPSPCCTRSTLDHVPAYSETFEYGAKVYWSGKQSVREPKQPTRSGLRYEMG